MNDHESLRFTLLDQQLVDAEDRPVGRVDDVLLDLPADGGPPVVVAVLTGAQALGERMGGPAGKLMAAVASRLRSGEHRAEPVAIPASAIGDHADLVQLTVPLGDLPHVAGLERWLAHHLVEGLPGAGDARD
ncbi:hypothetical protein GCM10020358_40220 [Amorphoplanes nipponensis]|uniref:PRC-barrel domain-containing protein n=1 Tax=Actinoplanes nipponensis TaxID=135950 RepID=A0A919JQ24_9ACTN|nr:hypothetical protein [Actinoplanes nipponensis]GIE53693.1 hypothetical protein Ani05nite_72270 [Actinoplanes nipponensis]